MKNKILLIYDFENLFHILYELENEINFKIINLTKSKFDSFQFNEESDYLLISQKKVNNLNRQLVINTFPIKFSKLLEKINIGFLRQNFIEKSGIKIGKYNIDVNSREIKYERNFLKLTEKECDVIIYLFKLGKTASIEHLQLNVWGHQSKLETHTVETHVYRLRKKISEKFNDNEFIISKKNGYEIK